MAKAKVGNQLTLYSTTKKKVSQLLQANPSFFKSSNIKAYFLMTQL
jgi:hypothetical protein